MRVQAELREDIKKLNESHVKLQIKLKTANKEYQKFKELLARTIRIEYAKIPTLTAVLEKGLSGEIQSKEAQKEQK